MYRLFSVLAFIHVIGIYYTSCMIFNLQTSCLFRYETLEFNLIDFGLALSILDPLGYVQRASVGNPLQSHYCTY